MYNPLDHKPLVAQIKRQKKFAWDLETDIAWQLGIDASKPLLPLDSDNIAFPGASAEQRLALSQLMGLIINSTVAEMEDVINQMKDAAWARVLRAYPVNPEMWDLGELFFIEEKKHSLAFYRYNTLFAETLGIEPGDLDRLLPKAFGSLFLKATIANAEAGGNAFWWTVASVEEVSIKLFQQIQGAKADLDPLYFDVHEKHMEEEARHHNYAFLMLELIERKSGGIKSWWHHKTDLLFAQLFSTAWVLAELSKVFQAKHFKHKHPFFAAIASCEPLFQQQSALDLIKKVFISAPYVSLVLNTKNHKKTTRIAEAHHVLSFPFPAPKKAS